MEPLTLATSLYPILGDQEFNPAKQTARNPADGNAKTVIDSREWVMEKGLSRDLATIVVDYAFPTPAQERFIRAYRDFVSQGCTLKGTSQTTRNVVAVARLALMRDGRGQFSYLSIGLQNNEQLAIIALRQHAFGSGQSDLVWFLLPPALHKRRNVLHAALEGNGNLLAFMPLGVKKDKEAVIVAVTCKGEALMHAHPDLQKDIDVVLPAVKNAGYALADAHPSLRKDGRVVIPAMIQNFQAIQFADPALQKEIMHQLRAAATKEGDTHTLGLMNDMSTGAFGICVQANPELRNKINRWLTGILTTGNASDQVQGLDS